jgi:hypothetical protein
MLLVEPAIVDELAVGTRQVPSATNKQGLTSIWKGDYSNESLYMHSETAMQCPQGDPRTCSQRPRL